VAKIAASSPVVVIGSRIRELARERGMRVSGETIRALNEAVCSLCEDAIVRAKANYRATIRARDL
jgi:histone H3/H4